jgi:hypothetical protein
MNEEPIFEQSHEEHRAAQIVRMAWESTAEQRIAWLEAALVMVHSLGIDYLAQRRRLREEPVGQSEPEKPLGS